MKEQIKLVSLYILVASFIGCSGGEEIESSYLKRQWVSSGAELSIPESVLYDPHQGVIYVSNVNSQESGNPWQDNGGFISKLNNKGKVTDLKWITGLKAPKGLTINGEHLYVSDLDDVVDINVSSGKVLHRWSAPAGVILLNDIVYDHANELIYVSDSGKKEIYSVNSAGKFTLLYPKERTKKPQQNGLLIENDRLLMQGTFGYLKSLNPLDTASVLTLSDSVGIAIDGITRYDDKGYIVSAWDGEIYFVDHQGNSKLLLESKPNRTADISYAPELGLLLVPNFDKNIVAYKVENLH